MGVLEESISHLKTHLPEDLILFITPLRERRAEIAKSDEVRQMLAQNGAIIREKSTSPCCRYPKEGLGFVV